jgi:hypothetical protein
MESIFKSLNEAEARHLNTLLDKIRTSENIPADDPAEKSVTG